MEHMESMKEKIPIWGCCWSQNQRGSGDPRRPAASHCRLVGLYCRFLCFIISYYCRVSYGVTDSRMCDPNKD